MGERSKFRRFLEGYSPRGPLDPEAEGTTIFPNVSNYLPVDTPQVQHQT